MGLRRLREFLRNHSRIALDTSVFIYYLEANARHLPPTDVVFSWIGESKHSAVTSTITMTALLVPSYRARNEAGAEVFYALLATCPNLEWIAPSLPIADTAAKMRADYNLRTPDALQAATALHSGATGFVTNDFAFERVTDIETLVLERLL